MSVGVLLVAELMAAFARVLMVARCCVVVCRPAFIRRSLETFLSVSALAYGAYFYSSHIELIPIVHRRHFVGVSPGVEQWIGEWMREQMLDGVVVLTDPQDERVKLVTQVGMRIASAANKPHWAWKFYVVEDPAINAVCFPGEGELVHACSTVLQFSIL
jgi:predicted Zn-dependent protease